ncbi:thiaminase II [Prosthecomicrobium pneumaticum]|uniref:Aminopyrimidine aminohydrolase n=1 Tax=Prosthecomicrobium pneumaticum TaxID=81895 RepID=A0A7W9FPT0_9HYPH|nr:thiaminase/transcriptional activator TenA [Prosthecomicrobium pneumaticum]
MSGLFERLKGDAAAAWSAYVEHDFVRGLGDGTLPEAAFRHYLVQDYLFLIEFARAYALGVSKAPTLADMRKSAGAMTGILGEMSLHIRLCAGWGIDAAALEAAPPARAMLAYTSFVLEAGRRGDYLDLIVALSPCVVGYAEIGTRLAARPHGRDPANPYAPWIAEYAGEAYQALAAEARAELDRIGAVYLTEARYPRLAALFAQATRLEADFWQMGLDQAD